MPRPAAQRSPKKLNADAEIDYLIGGES